MCVGLMDGGSPVGVRRKIVANPRLTEGIVVMVTIRCKLGIYAPTLISKAVSATIFRVRGFAR